MRIKARLAAFFVCAAVLLQSAAFAATGGLGSEKYSYRVSLSDDLTYTNSIFQNAAGKRVESYSIDIAAGGKVYPIVMACDTVYGGMTITQMISYAKKQGYNVVGAMNGDFGYYSTRIPCGMVVEDGILKSSSDTANAIAFTENGAFVSLVPSVNLTLRGEDFSIETTHFNKSRDDSGYFLYSQHFSTVSTRTEGEGVSVRMKIPEGETRLGETLSLEVTEVWQDDKAHEIGEGYMVLSWSEASGLGDTAPEFAVGDTLSLEISCSDERLYDALWVSGCGNLLAENGEIYGNPKDWDKSIQGYHPRSAIGIRDDGSMVFHVADGRSSKSAGATMEQIARELLAMGCTTVVNMDGGGSSAISVRLPATGLCTVMNAPSDGALRSCPGYILLVTDEEGSGRAENLFSSADGKIILAGKSMSLDYYASDNAMGLVAVPENIIAAASVGSVKDGFYTAPERAGTDVISLSADKATGESRVTVIEKADELVVKNAAGGAVGSLSLDPGEKAELSVTARYLLRNVLTGDEKAQFSCDESIGSISEDGVFTAAENPGADGKISVSFAGVTKEIPVSIKLSFSDIKGHWAQDFIQSLRERGVVSGVTSTTYAPEQSIKRGDFILMLYNALGKPETQGESPFGDVDKTDYYASAIIWAAENGVAYGSGEGIFSPQEALTRQQAFSFIYRALDKFGIADPGADTELLGAFSDAADVADYAVDSCAGLYKLGIISGDGGKLLPENTLTRAEMASVLYSVLDIDSDIKTFYKA